MNMTKVRMLMYAAISVMALMILSLIAINNWLDATSVEIYQPTPTKLEAKASTESEFNFTILDKPRALPEIHFVDGDERTLTIADFKGKVVLLNVWATWCGPCRHEMPTLDRLQAKLGGPDFEVLALSIDRQGPPAVKAFYKELGLKALRVYADASGKAARNLSAVGLPTTLLVDRKGNEIGRLVGPAEWDTSEMIDFLRQRIAEVSKP